MEFIPIDSFTKVVDNKTEFFLYGKSMDRKRIVVRVDFKPYFYLSIRDEDMYKVHKELKEFEIFHDDIKLNVLDVVKVRNNYYKICINRLKFIEYFALRLISWIKSKEITCGFESLQIKQKFDLFNFLGINCFKLCNIEFEPIEIFNYTDLRTDYIVSLKRIEEIRNLDEEELNYFVNIVYCNFIFKSGSSNRPIWMINSRIRSFNKLIQWKNPRLKQTDYCESENDLLNNFSQFLNKIKPDVILCDENDLHVLNKRFRRYGIKNKFFLDKDQFDLKLKSKKGLLYIDPKNFHKKLNLFPGLEYEALYKKYFGTDLSPLSSDYLLSVLSKKESSNFHLAIEENLENNYNYFSKFYFNIIRNICVELTLPMKIFVDSNLNEIIYFFLYYKYKSHGFSLKWLKTRLSVDKFRKIETKSGLFKNLIHLDLSFLASKYIADNNIGQLEINGISLNKIILDGLNSDLDSIYRDEFSHFLFNKGLINYFNSDSQNYFDYNTPIFFKYLTKLLFYENAGVYLMNNFKYEVNLDEILSVLINELAGKGFEILYDKDFNFYIDRDQQKFDSNTFLDINNMILDLNLVLSKLKFQKFVSNYNLYLSSYLFENETVIGLDYDLSFSGLKVRNMKLLNYFQTLANHMITDYDYYSSIRSSYHHREYFDNLEIIEPKSDKAMDIIALKNSLIKKIKLLDLEFFLIKRKANFYSEQFMSDFSHNDLEGIENGDTIFYAVMLVNGETGARSKKVIVNDLDIFRSKLGPDFSINFHYYSVLLDKYSMSFVKLLD